MKFPGVHVGEAMEVLKHVNRTDSVTFNCMHVGKSQKLKKKKESQVWCRIAISSHSAGKKEGDQTRSSRSCLSLP